MEKDELMKLIWPDSVVEEGNLNKNISELRRFLGEKAREHRYIVTVPGRGYSFVSNVREIQGDGDEKTTPTREPAAIHQEEELEEAPEHSIAVLPFKLLKGEGGDETLGLGIADATITRLSRLSKLVVRPTSTIARYTTSVQVSAVGRELRVASVLEGSIRRASDRLRVSAQLVNVKEERTVWAAQFDERFTDLFTVEDRVSQKIAEAMEVEITEVARNRRTCKD
jgi:TolB-like protein